MLNKKLPILAIVLLCFLTAKSIAPILNSPRIGDKVSVFECSEPNWIDSLCMCPSLAKSNVISEKMMEVWAPAPGDSVSAYVITMGREVLIIEGCLGDYYCRNISKPGLEIHYDRPITFSISDSLNIIRPYKSISQGYSIENSCADGYVIQNIASGLVLITQEGDSIANVECLLTENEGITISQSGDQYKLSGISRAWYAPGYRYPLLSENTCCLTTLQGDTIDCYRKWEIISPEFQENEISDDYLNEFVRCQINSPEKHEYESLKPEGSNSFCDILHFNDSRTQLTVKSKAVDYSLTDLLLCNSKGIVLDYHKFDNQDYIIDLGSTANQVLILYINTTARPITLKFVK